jgi:hypothetical protein
MLRCITTNVRAHGGAVLARGLDREPLNHNLNGFLRGGGLYRPEVFAALANDVHGPAGHCSPFLVAAINCPSLGPERNYPNHEH